MASRSPNSATADICSLAQTLAAKWKSKYTEVYEISDRDLAAYVVYEVFCWRQKLDGATSAGSAGKIADTLAKKYANAAKCSAEDFAAILVQDWKNRHNMSTDVLPPEPDTISAPTDAQSDVLPPNALPSEPNTVSAQSAADETTPPDGMLLPEPNAVYVQSAADETAPPDGMLPPEPNVVLAQSAADETALPSEPVPELGAAQPMWCLPVVCATQPLPQPSAPVPQENPGCRVQFAALKQSARGIFDLLGFCLALSPMPPCPGMSTSQPSTDPELLTVQPAQPPPYDSAQ